MKNQLKILSNCDLDWEKMCILSQKIHRRQIASWFYLNLKSSSTIYGDVVFFFPH